MADMKQAVFRVDATVSVGGGHVGRCLALADELSRIGWRCAFATVEETLDVFPAMATGEYDIRLVPPCPRGAVHSMRSYWPEDIDLLVVDHYELDAQFETDCRPWARATMVVDDLANRPHCCDWLLDQTFGRGPDAYRGLVPESCVLLCGTGYALLRPQFAKYVFKKQPIASGRVLVAMGTTDPDNVTERVLESLSRAQRVGTIDVVLGSAAPNLAAVSDCAASMAVPTTVHTDVSDMAARYASSDLVVGSGGVSALERCALGVPSVIIVVAENQRAVVHNIVEAGAAVTVDDATRLAETVDGMFGEPLALERVANKATALCDGRGVGRIAMVLEPEHASDGGPVRLRVADIADAELMLAWQQAPETRRFAHNPEIPNRATHFAWCRRKLADPDSFMSIVLHNEAPASVLRLDRSADDDEAGVPAYVVSILVAPDRLRRGIGSAALKLARRLTPEALLLAEVHQDNSASQTLFGAAGYTWRTGRFEQRPGAAVPVEKANTNG